jgi:ribosomal protein S18 acetylase RimI-like enzyme
MLNHDRARDRGVRHLLLCTQSDMRTAQHLYEREGFVRLKERDRRAAEFVLLAYGLVLADAR